MPAFRGHFSVQGSAIGGLSYKVKNTSEADLFFQPVCFRGIFSHIMFPMRLSGISRHLF